LSDLLVLSRPFVEIKIRMCLQVKIQPNCINRKVQLLTVSWSITAT
jgi:hypothetical protein